jgi:hypothetical protein
MASPRRCHLVVLGCELSHRHTAPHLGPCLIVDDLRRDGHQVRALHCHASPAVVDELAGRLAGRVPDLVAVDSIWPVAALRRLREALPGVPFVVGGLNALASFTAAGVELCIVGPAREAMRALAARLPAGPSPGERPPAWPVLDPGALAEVPNLFFRLPDGQVDHSGREVPWDALREMRPFTPFLDWEYVGPERHPGAGLRELSLVPEFGCYHRLSPDRGDLGTRSFAFREARHPGFGGRFTGRAEAVARRQLGDNRGGCTFCVFRWQSFTTPARPDAVELLVEQARHYRALGVADFSLQSEDPFRLLPAALEGLQAAGASPRWLILRCTAAALLRGEAALREALRRSQAGQGPRLRVQQVGFESFVERDLELFNKGISASDNRAAARLLTRLEAEHPGHFDGRHGHGLILFHPWTRLEDLAENLEAIDRDAPFLAPRATLEARLTLYSELSPVALLAARDGLLEPSPAEFGLGYRYADERVAQLRAVVGALTDELARRPGLAAVGGRPQRLERARARLLRLVLARLLEGGALDDRFLDEVRREAGRLLAG